MLLPPDIPAPRRHTSRQPGYCFQKIQRKCSVEPAHTLFDLPGAKTIGGVCQVCQVWPGFTASGTYLTYLPYLSLESWGIQYIYTRKGSWWREYYLSLGGKGSMVSGRSGMSPAQCKTLARRCERAWPAATVPGSQVQGGRRQVS